jgi:TPR repeat protein
MIPHQASLARPFSWRVPRVRGERELKHRSGANVASSRKLSSKSVDDRTADRKTHPHTVGFCREERVEYPFNVFGANACSGVHDRYHHATAVEVLGPNGQLGDRFVTVDTDYLLARAQIGDADAQFSLGVIYENVGGGRKSLAADAKQGAIEAAKWYRLAANQGHAAAQYQLADFYDHGIGVPKDFAEAAKWFRRSAEKGHSGAQRWMGDLYDQHSGVGSLDDKNDAEAVKWYGLAASQGNSEAQFSLGVLYDEGRGVAENAADRRRSRQYETGSD